MFGKYLKKFSHPITGLTYATIYDRGFRVQLYFLTVVTFGVITFYEPLSWQEFLFVALAYILILITELQNSALEHTLDRLHPEHDEQVGHSKDMAAASVLMAGVFLLIVLVVISWQQFM